MCEKKSSKALKIFTVGFGESTLNKKIIYTSFSQNTNKMLMTMGGCLNTSTAVENIESLKKMFWRITIIEVAEHIGICHATRQRSLFQNFDQKNRRIAQELLNDVNDDPDMLRRVINGDKIWVYDYDVETKRKHV